MASPGRAPLAAKVPIGALGEVEPLLLDATRCQLPSNMRSSLSAAGSAKNRLTATISVQKPSLQQTRHWHCYHTFIFTAWLFLPRDFETPNNAIMLGPGDLI